MFRAGLLLIIRRINSV